MIESASSAPPIYSWTYQGQTQTATFSSDKFNKPAPRVLPIDDTCKADEALRMASEGHGLVWMGDYHNARQLVSALSRRMAHKAERSRPKLAAKATPGPAQAFHTHRLVQLQRAKILNSIWLPMQAGYQIALRRAPDVAEACEWAWGADPTAQGETTLRPLRDIQAAVGAAEWRKKGVEIPALGESPHNRIFPWYGVFSPVRGEYLELLQAMKLPEGARTAFDIGTGTGVIAALLARRGLQVVATDNSPQALGCAQSNLTLLGVTERVTLQQANLFPQGQADLVVCNPPWLPAKASSPIEMAIYDENSAMLKGFLNGVCEHLTPQGEVWLVLSDLAEHLGLRTRIQLLDWIKQAGLRLKTHRETRPVHSKVQDETDPLHAARAKEVTRLWCLERL